MPPVTNSTFGAYVTLDKCINTVLAPGASCSFSLAWHAGSTPGPYSGTLEVWNGDEIVVSQPMTAQVESQVLSFTVDGHTVGDNGTILFPSTPPPTGMLTKSITITNVGSAPANPLWFTQPTNATLTGNCGNTLAPQASCTMVYTHSQIAFGGVLDETLAISAGGANSVRLLQWFSDLQVSAGALSLANGATQTVTITNVSSDTVSGVTAYGQGPAVTSHCGTTLAANASCTVDVQLSSSHSGDDVVITATGYGFFLINIEK
jgi:hypothetical protein